MPSDVTGHLTEADVEALGAELDRIREEVLANRGESDARYIRRVIAVQRGLEAGGRAMLLVSLLPPAWVTGTALLSVAKILENMEIGHNVLHGQWDWMRDPKIHSTTWEFDLVTPAAAWKRTHNEIHHTWTNVVGKDRDLGYTILRVSEDQPWHPLYLAQPLYNALLAPVFEWGIALYDLEFDAVVRGEKSTGEFLREVRGLLTKATRQVTKDYLLFPLLSGPSALPCLLGSLTANVTRNVWAHTVIFCGHFPEATQTFTEEEIADETRGAWYLRQLLGSANIEGSRLFHIMTGNLSHQIEHHLFPDLPSNRYAEIAPRVRDLCAKYRLPYITGPLTRQYASMWKRLLRHALPTRPSEHATASKSANPWRRRTAA
ncbi:acyl-CoA desaturase [Carbonactinospora thermoautotrophica]|uniref:fatty acid desaturase family protein n=1 Tax=Carbonactinospora thermoautotrophica TaxID=1469144 RepID=UPI002271EECF|nr:acyl-CoA desaturase [Carbonactinospora thermoautotrophica]MCX9190883.1 acyl-CoA desaturase [Carbonactinospora thermoautotrophica]